MKWQDADVLEQGANYLLLFRQVCAAGILRRDRLSGIGATARRGLCRSLSDLYQIHYVDKLQPWVQLG
jgi:hypothetical protein